MVHCIHYDRIYVGKTYPTAPESLVDYLVGSIDHTSRVAATLQRISGQSQAGKFSGVGSFKRKHSIVGQSHGRFSGGHTLLKTQRIAYRQMHVRQSQLGLHGPVGKLDHGMDYTLRMHHGGYPVGGDPEKPVSFDDLKRLVEHGSRIYGDFSAHAPVWVTQGVVGRHMLKIFFSESAERAAGSSDDQA